MRLSLKLLVRQVILLLVGRDVSGLTTLSSALQIEQGVANGIVFNSNRTNEDGKTLILVKDDSDDNNHGVPSWASAWFILIQW